MSSCRGDYDHLCWDRKKQEVAAGRLGNCRTTAGDSVRRLDDRSHPTPAGSTLGVDRMDVEVADMRAVVAAAAVTDNCDNCFDGGDRVVTVVSKGD